MAADERVTQLEQFLTERGAHLLRTAMLLTGRTKAGEDLLQAALERMLRRWHTIDGNPEGYLRRTIYNLAADGWRRKGRWRARLGVASRRRRRDGRPTAARRWSSGTNSSGCCSGCRRGSGPRSCCATGRTCSEAQAAEVLGCSASTVRSATSRGLHRLRGAAVCTISWPSMIKEEEHDDQQRLRGPAPGGDASSHGRGIPPPSGLVRRARRAGPAAAHDRCGGHSGYRRGGSGGGDSGRGPAVCPVPSSRPSCWPTARPPRPSPSRP